MNSNKLSTLSVSENGKKDKRLDLKVSSFDLFEDRRHYLNSSRIYFAYFEKIASMKCIKEC